ncbi:MAG TPA: DUF1499 domain-containing protein [Burkholderiales bacterium]|nr:DUF1499 domain-containing protein [Burkholderiales bacterium]
MKRTAWIVAWCGTGVVLASAVAAVAGGFGTRYGVWDYRMGFTIVRWAAYIAAGAGVVAVIGLVLAVLQRASQPAVIGLVGAVVSLAVLWPAWSAQRSTSLVPRIHDITTDTENPPAFVAIVPLRKGAPNAAEYDGPKTAAAQKAAYSDIKPLQMSMPPAQAFDRALSAARDMGWEIVAAEPAQGRIEATDRTFWFGFKDDVVIRVAAADGGSRIDVRSKSRVGASDRGMNAKRVRVYMHKLSQAATDVKIAVRP